MTYGADEIKLTEEEIAVLLDYHQQMVVEAEDEGEVEEISMRKKRIAEFFLLTPSQQAKS